MRRNIFLLATITLFVLATTNYAQTPKAKPSPKETAKSTMPEWPECCWVGKATDAAMPTASEQSAAPQTAAETSSGAASGASSGAGFTTSGGEESEEGTTEESADKSKDLKQKLIGAAIKAVATKLKNKNDESSESSTTTDSSYIGETEKNVNSDPVNSVQEVKQPNGARRQRLEALRAKMGNATTTPTTTTTTNVTTDPLDSVQEIKRPGTSARRGTQQRQVSGDTTNAALTETPVNRTRPLRNPANANAPTTTTQQPPTQVGNAGARPLNHPKLAAIRAARQGNQNARPPRRTPRERPQR